MRDSESGQANSQFRLAVTSWIDLRGYGTTIASAGFNPMDSKSIGTIDRLRDFHRVIAKHSVRDFRSLTINDGAVFYRDLQWRSNSAAFEFLVRSWRMFREVNSVDQDAGWLGARLVLAVGFRVLGSRRGIDASVAHVRSIIQRLEAKEISSEQAIRQASSDGRHSDIIPQLQGNFSFSKSYLAEKSGTKGGLPGSNFYVDLALFAEKECDWIQLGTAIRWSDGELDLTANFAQVHNIVDSALTDVPPGLRDGITIAEALAPSHDVLAALHAMRR